MTQLSLYILLVNKLNNVFIKNVCVSQINPKRGSECRRATAQNNQSRASKIRDTPPLCAVLSDSPTCDNTRADRSGDRKNENFLYPNSHHVVLC